MKMMRHVTHAIKRNFLFHSARYAAVRRIAKYGRSISATNRVFPEDHARLNTRARHNHQGNTGYLTGAPRRRSMSRIKRSR